MQEKTHTNTAPPPYLDIAAQLKSDATIIAKALKDTEEHGKDKPVLLWIYYHEGIKYTELTQEKSTPPGWFLCEAYQTTSRNKKTETVHYNLLQHGFDQDTQIAISANKLRPNGDITKSRRPPPLKREVTTETKLELETTTSDFLKCMCTAATGPPISDDDPLQKLQLPPEIKTGATVTLNDLRKHAREIANSKIMTLPYLTQAAHLAGTYITPTDLKQFTTATTTKVKETTTKEKETTTSQREIEISLILEEMDTWLHLGTEPTGPNTPILCQCLLGNETKQCGQNTA